METRVGCCHVQEQCTSQYAVKKPCRKVGGPRIHTQVLRHDHAVALPNLHVETVDRTRPAHDLTNIETIFAKISLTDFDHFLPMMKGDDRRGGGYDNSCHWYQDPLVTKLGPEEEVEMLRAQSLSCFWCQPSITYTVRYKLLK